MYKASSNNWFVKHFKNGNKTMSFKGIDKKCLNKVTWRHNK